RRKAIEDEKQYLKAKGIFFGLAFTDSLICVKVIESVEEMAEEGRTMHHCVGGYHNKANSLILSATIDGKRIETIEVSLKTLKVVQSRGVCNSNTEYHDRIIRLVEDNTELIRQRMNAA
ncbi:PcfJ-like protein, partial [Bifidobacterium longum]